MKDSLFLTDTDRAKWEFAVPDPAPMRTRPVVVTCAIALIVIAIIAFMSGPAHSDGGGWIVAVGEMTQNKVQCDLDAASVGLVLQKARIRCVRVTQ